MTKQELMTLIATAEAAQAIESELPAWEGFFAKWVGILTAEHALVVRSYVAIRVIALDTLEKQMEGAELMMWEAPE